MHLGRFPGSTELQSWRVNFKNDVCTRTADPQLAVHWIQEVEIAKSMDELMTSRSIVGRTDFPDIDMIDAMIASALKRLFSTQIHFRERASVEEQRAQKHDRFSRGRQIAYMIYEYFRAAGAYEAVQELSDLFAKLYRMTDQIKRSSAHWTLPGWSCPHRNSLPLNKWQPAARATRTSRPRWACRSRH